MDSKSPLEAALTTDLRGEPYNFSLWDIHTGTQLVVFKGNKANPNSGCLQLVDNNYFITATDNVLQVWSIYNRKCQEQKIFLPNRPSVLCISPCGKYLSAGISHMIYVWQLSSGNLVAHAQRHHETVSVLKMNQDGTFLFSGGEDSATFVWPFADLISRTHNTGSMNLSGQFRRDAGVNEPKFVWLHHTKQVTDIHVTDRGRCITASNDSTLNIYDYIRGNRLYNLVMSSPLWSVVMDKNERRIFLGAENGNIYEVGTSSLSLPQTNSEKPVLVGHKDKVVGLSISIDGSRLISASKDSSCKIWDLHQKKLLQDIKHQAPLANLTTLLIPNALALTSLTQANSKAQLSLKPLKRNMYKPPRDGTLSGADLFEDVGTTIIQTKNRLSYWETGSTTEAVIADNSDLLTMMPKLIAKQSQHSAIVDPTSVDQSPDKESLQKLREKIKDLYLLSAEKIFQDAANESLRPFKSVVDEIEKVDKIIMTNGKKSSKKPAKVKESRPVKKSRRD